MVRFWSIFIFLCSVLKIIVSNIALLFVSSVINGAETAYPDGPSEFSLGVSICSFFLTIGRLFVLSISVIVLSVLIRFVAFDCHFAVFNLFFLLLSLKINEASFPSLLQPHGQIIPKLYDISQVLRKGKQFLLY